LKLRYTNTYKCREHGIFIKKNMQNVHETIDCPTCGRTSDLTEGFFTCVAEHKRVIPKTQKKLEVV